MKAAPTEATAARRKRKRLLEFRYGVATAAQAFASIQPVPDDSNIRDCIDWPLHCIRMVLDWHPAQVRALRVIGEPAPQLLTPKERTPRPWLPEADVLAALDALRSRREVRTAALTSWQSALTRAYTYCDPADPFDPQDIAAELGVLRDMLRAMKAQP